MAASLGQSAGGERRQPRGSILLREQDQSVDNAVPPHCVSPGQQLSRCRIPVAACGAAAGGMLWVPAWLGRLVGDHRLWKCSPLHHGIRVGCCHLLPLVTLCMQRSCSAAGGWRRLRVTELALKRCGDTGAACHRSAAVRLWTRGEQRDISGNTLARGRH